MLYSNHHRSDRLKISFNQKLIFNKTGATQPQNNNSTVNTLSTLIQRDTGLRDDEITTKFYLSTNKEIFFKDETVAKTNLN